jgi:hypothetical protein
MGQCSALAPDETSYLEVFQKIYFESSKSFVNFAGTSDFVYRIYFIPAKLIAVSGVEPIYAIRFSAVVFWQLAFLVIYFLITKYQVQKIRWIISLQIALAISPMIFGSLGIKESFLYFCIVIVFLALQFNLKNRIYLGSILLTLGLTLLAFTKLYLYLIFVLAILIGLGLIRASKIQIYSILFGIIMSLFITINNTDSNTRLVGLFEMPWVINTKPTFTSPKFNSFDGSVTWRELKECHDQRKFGYFAIFTKPTISFLENRNTNITRSESSDTTRELTSATDFINPGSQRSINLGPFLPIKILNFMIGPLLGFGGGLSFLSFFDSFLWFIFYSVMCLSILRKYSFEFRLSELSLFAGLFCVIFLVVSAMVEVNLGTLFRHRSILVIPAILILSSIKRR